MGFRKSEANEFLLLTQEQKAEHCEWCWKHACFRCYSCLLFAERYVKKLETISDAVWEEQG